MHKLRKYFGRRRNKTFYVTLTAQLLLAIQLILAVFGMEDLLDATLQNKILAAVNAVFVVLATLGVIIDPKSDGITDKDGDGIPDDEQ